MMADMTPEEQYEAKCEELGRILQELIVMASEDADDERFRTPVLVEWTVFCYGEHMAGLRTDESGDNVDDYFSFHSPHLPCHRAEGLLRLSLRRIREGE